MTLYLNIVNEGFNNKDEIYSSVVGGVVENCQALDERN